MCVSILYTRDEILGKNTVSNDKRYRLFVRILCSTIPFRKYLTLKCVLWEICDQILYPGTRYGFYVSKKEVNDESILERINNFKHHILLFIVKELIFEGKAYFAKIFSNIFVKKK